MYPVTISIFFPCYNEEHNIESLVTETREVLDGLVQQYEIIIIDDGSFDKTGSIADTLQQLHDNIRVIHHQVNRGYGAALISGFRNSRYEWVFFTDGDNQFFMKEIELLLQEADAGDAVIGFRKNRQDRFHRIVYARAWHILIGRVFGLMVRDIDCAFKLIKIKFLENLALRSSGALISTELLMKLKHAGARIKEVGVSHRPRQFGTQTGGSPKVIIRAFVELFKLYRELK